LPALLHTLGRLHAAGLVQEDLHLGNFLRHQGGSSSSMAMRCGLISRGSLCRLHEATANLAVLLAQLPPAWDDELPLLLPAHAAGAGVDVPDGSAARADRQGQAVALARPPGEDGARLQPVRRHADRSAFHRRRAREAGALAAVIASPDEAMGRHGSSRTAARVRLRGSSSMHRPLLIKRYNLKGLGHALGRACVPAARGIPGVQRTGCSSSASRRRRRWR
jgi:hypothetical protein